MKKRICDLCKTNEASRSFKVKESIEKRDRYGWFWTYYSKIDVCRDCGKKLFNISLLKKIPQVHGESKSIIDKSFIEFPE